MGLSTEEDDHPDSGGPWLIEPTGAGRRVHRAGCTHADAAARPWAVFTDPDEDRLRATVAAYDGTVTLCPDCLPAGIPKLPAGIVEAERCGVSVGHHTAHKPHTWAWDPTRPDVQLYPRDSRQLPPGAEPYWCDGGVPGGER